jgi:amino acid adenylation domain-containing protein
MTTTSGSTEPKAEPAGVAPRPASAVGREPPDEAPDLLVAIAQATARRPDHPAVEASDATLTYAELDRLSNQLAHRLLSLGVGRDACVGISLPRGAAEVLAILATSKAGGAYVPLDPSHPLDRLQIILEDARPQVLVVHPSSPLATAGAAGHLVVLDDIARATTGYEVTPPSVLHDPAQLAYVLFTSGSTGRPKGVEISRGAFSSFIRSMTHEPGISESDRLLAVSTTSFDIAGLELLLPLAAGATVVVADRATVVDPRQLRRRLENDGITFMQATPATWRLLLEAGWSGHERLKMLCGGEAMSGALADRLLVGGGELWNMYGPTETTVWSSLQLIGRGYDLITIGKPIDRTQLYVLDPERNLVDTGAIGELYIGGLGLARGYRGRAELTAERFIANPHGPAGDLIYRTGDLARMLPDGRLECLGRIDHQVKIRGYRIELGEIESVLRQVPGVKEVLVVAEEQEGDPKLCAYWVGDAARETLLENARRRLPAYMVPSAYVHLEVFPLNTNGKIDRKNLPRSDAAPAARDLPPVKRPRDDAETRIAVLWGRVLGLPEVGIDQDFFALGGTSVAAIDLRSRIEAELGVEIPMAAFFESPTVEKLAAQLGQERVAASPDAPIVVELRRGNPARPPLFCLLGVQLYHDLALALPDDRPVIGMHLPFRFRPGLDHRPTVTEMAAGYLELIRQRQAHGPYFLAGLCFGGIVAFEAGRQLEAAGEEVALVAVFDGALPSGIRTNQAERLRSYLRSAVREPQQIPAFVRRSFEGLSARLPWRRGRRPVKASRPIEAHDVPIAGAEADAEVARYAANLTPIAGRLVSIRATAEVFPSWMTLEPHLGWDGLARKLVFRDVAATHMELLHEPHVRVVAETLAEALADGRAPAADPRLAASA